MRKTLKDLFYGNIEPSDKKFIRKSEYDMAMKKIAVLEESLLKTLKADEQELLSELTDSQITATGISAEENFILGFRLGARIMREIYDDEDGAFLEII